MTPEKFFEYLEGKLPPDERAELERALIADPELQQQLFAARQIHQGLSRTPEENAVVAKASRRGRQVAAAFVVLVAMNVGLGLIYIFHENKPSKAVEDARVAALRSQLETSLEKAAASAFPTPTLEPETITIPVPVARQQQVGEEIIAAAGQTGGSGTRDLPNDRGEQILVLVPAAKEKDFRQELTNLGAPSTSPSAPAGTAPNEPVHLRVVLAAPH